MHACTDHVVIILFVVIIAILTLCHSIMSRVFTNITLHYINTLLPCIRVNTIKFLDITCPLVVSKRYFMKIRCVLDYMTICE